MSVPAVLPTKTSAYLRTFLISLLIIALLLVGFLFGVHMEASVSGDGIIKAKEQQNLRAPVSGLIKLGWYEGSVEQDGGRQLVRVDKNGNGVAEPVAGQVPHFVAVPGKAPGEGFPFHALEDGDFLWPGQPLAQIQPEGEIGEGAGNPSPPGKTGATFRAVVVPPKHLLWQVLKVHVEPTSFVKAGDAVAMIVPVDAATKEPKDVYVDLTVNERSFGEVQKGEAVRIYSNIYNRRLHGYAEATVTSVSLLAVKLDKGGRGFHAKAVVTESPFRLPLGSTVQGQIVTGRKQVYRLILEN
jgi:hypothetical protein